MKYTLIFSAILALAAAAPQAATCECEDFLCIQSWPDSCYCGNDAARACFEKCGGVEPQYQDCGEGGSDSPSTPYQRCGSRGMEPCAEGEICIDDPARDPSDCGISCDSGNGYCVPETPCGGLLASACGDGQTCIDDERDDCDPNNGGSDCIGLCFTPQ